MKLNNKIIENTLSPMLKDQLGQFEHKEPTCIYCKTPFFRTLEQEAFINGVGSKYTLHLDCIQDFISYWSVELLGEYKDVEGPQALHLGINISYIDLRDINKASFYKYIIDKLTQQTLSKLPIFSKIEDIKLFLLEDPNDLVQSLGAVVRFAPVCMICKSTFALKSSTYSATFSGEDLIFPTESQVLETLKQTEDGQFIFHPTCLNHTINYFKTYSGGHNGKK